MESPNYVNHIVLVLDSSLSMTHLASEAIKVADNQVVGYLAQRSKELDQETRVTVYTFNSVTGIQCIFYDKDVLRLPSLASRYKAEGNTPLIDATFKSIEDLRQTPQIYGDHAFLIYVLTDGQENVSRHTASQLSQEIQGLPDNWTLACMVPDQLGIFEAKKFGFPVQNIAIWDATSVKGMTEVGEKIKITTESFMQARIQGIRGSRNLFEMDTANLTSQTVKTKLHKLTKNEYSIISVEIDGWQIRDYVEQVTGKPYYTGMAYYEITKPETVQANKKICVMDKYDNSVYTGSSARSLLGLPNEEVRVRPSDHYKYVIFIQSTSINRKLVKGTNLLLMTGL